MNRKIARLREEIADLDRDLIELLERRFHLAEQVGVLKAEDGQPVMVHEVEQRVLNRARDAARFCGVSPDLMEAIFTAVIRGSVERQHRVGVQSIPGRGERTLILGAAGGMGGWLRLFLEGIGHTTEGVDPSWKDLPAQRTRYARLEEVIDLNDFDAIFVAVPLEATAETLERLGELNCTAPVFEVASVKSQLEKPLKALRRAGTPAIALHPMFGPSKNPLEPLNMVHAVIEEEEKERALILRHLTHPYLNLVSMPFEHHDRLIGWLLGLAHLSGILFADALSRSGLEPFEFERAPSTTFSRQVATARSVLEENPDLYFAIQRLNPFRKEVYAALQSALDELTRAVERNDCRAFTD
ncbi:MAG: prephenate dehydrogenase/arogenate dehydrogenase family protein, partial [Planctomycetes bacterium]|nr:prephenate dehydrogenase/arogenate dehydrogenase family protein [Planctomycetota bacterium]